MRVYFLGAGASKSLCPDQLSYKGLPLASEMTIEHLLDLSNYSYRKPDLTMATNIVRSKVVPEHLTKSAEDVIPEIMSDAPAYQALRICLMDRLWLADVWGTAEMTGWLQNIESSKDILITTNYDTLLERAIHRRRFKQGSHRKDMGLLDYGVPGEFLAPGYERLAYTMSPDAILLLKLHGSISWSYCNNCKKAELDPTYMGRASNALSGADHCPTCGLSLSPILVGPGHKKYDHPIIDEIHAVAHNMLSQANEVVFVGFSLNQNDHQIYQLFAALHKIAKTESVMLVDPRADLLLPIYRTIYGDVVTCHPQNSWKEYLDAIFPLRQKSSGDRDCR